MNDTTELLSHIKLRFNIDHPSYEDCYLYGYDCAVAELIEEENPFPEGSAEYLQWQEGWWAGFYGETPIFNPAEEADIALEPAAHEAANDHAYPFISNLVNSQVLINILKITGAIAATAVVGYQVIELVA
ncbi:MAG: transmission trait enhancer LetE [Tatlockia sp.]|nr:transmission trait enhancer LetE [Tatlockia sp.]